MILQSGTLPPLPQLHPLTSLRPAALPPTSSLTAAIPPSGTISESSTRLSDLSGLPGGPFSASSLSDAARDSRDLLCALPFEGGYIPILPRTSSASGLFRKRCETCATTHDGSFGAGRFCSSRCARTVGGLAHRKKRLLERGAKARQAAESRRAKRARIAKKDGPDSPRGVMQIGALLNPCE